MQKLSYKPKEIMFRERPLTWLFVVATICVDLVLFAGDWSNLKVAVWNIGLLLGQSAALGIWAAVSERHRLERGALFVVGQIALTLIACFSRNDPELTKWGTIIGTNSIYGIATLTIALLLRIILQISLKSSTPVRFSLIELFGWTLVVSIASAVMRQASFSHLLNSPGRLAALAGAAVLIGSAGGTLLTRHAAVGEFAVWAIVIAMSAAYFAQSLLIAARLDGNILLISMAYAALWIIVLRLDAPSPVHTVPQTPRDA